MNRDELIKVAAWAFYDATGPHSDDPHMWEDLIPHISAALDAIEPIIRGDEIAKYDEVWRGAHEQYRRELRAGVEALPTDDVGRTIVVARDDVLDLIDGSSDA